MPPQAPLPTQVAPTQTGQVNPAIMRALLLRRAQMNAQGAPGAGTAPNAMRPGAVQAPVQAPNTAMRPPGGANPAAAVMKAAGQAQSPLVADQGTRALAKALIQKLMQHM